MIGFFRRIRKKLADQNKFVQYSRYAVGEIVLVMIGILLALQVNNWNEERKNKIIEKETLMSLNSDLESALSQLNYKIVQNQGFKTNDSILLDIIHYKKSVSKDSIENLILGHIFSPGFDPELGTLNEILSTGKMDVIRNRDLRNHISTWNKYMDELFEVDEKLAHLDLQIKEPLYSEQIPMKNALHKYLTIIIDNPERYPKSNFDWNPEELFQNIEFENMLSNYILYSSIQYSRLIDIKMSINEMIGLISQEISND